MLRKAFITAFKPLAAGLIISLSSLIAPSTAMADKYAAIVIDADTNEVLHARSADEPRYPASLTKVMTLYMLFDALKSGEVSLDEKLTVSRFAASQAPSNLKLKPGSTITVKEAIRALVTKSANDVAVVIAERIGGSESRFARLMTMQAKSLGMNNTKFMNASGLPNDQQLTTARDLAILGEAVLTDHADFYHYFSNPRFTWGKKTYKNHNKLLTQVRGVDGIKTGYTRASGFNLMTAAKRDGHRVIAIMLGGNTAKARNAHVSELVEAAFATYETPEETLQLASFDMIQTPVAPNGAAEPTLNGRRLSVILAEGDSDIEPTTAVKTIAAPVKAPLVVKAKPEPKPVPAISAAPILKKPAEEKPFSLAEYQARQMGLAE